MPAPCRRGDAERVARAMRSSARRLRRAGRCATSASAPRILRRAADALEARDAGVLRRCSSRRRARPGRLPWPKCAKRSTSCATTRRGRARHAPRDCPGRPARATSCGCTVAGLGLHQPLEFPARDLHRPGRGGARDRQHRARQARRADAGRRGCKRSSCCTSRRARDALHLHGPGETVGAALVARSAHRGRRASPARRQVARIIDRALPAQGRPIVPLIAETGGINAMWSTPARCPSRSSTPWCKARSARPGQRCSALRLLCVHETSPTASSG